LSLRGAKQRGACFSIHNKLTISCSVRNDKIKIGFSEVSANELVSFYKEIWHRIYFIEGQNEGSI
jgi:hypothetical protein